MFWRGQHHSAFRHHVALLGLLAVIVLFGAIAFASGNVMLIIIEMMLIGCMFLGLRAPIPAFGLSGVLVVVASLVMFAMGFERYGMLNGFALSLLALAIPMLGSAWRGRDSLVKRGAK